MTFTKTLCAALAAALLAGAASAEGWYVSASAGVNIQDDSSNLGDGTTPNVAYPFRTTDDIETDNDLFPGTLEIDNRQNLVSAGLRFSF